MQSKTLALYLMKQFESLNDVTLRAMMGGYIFYYKQKIFGGIYKPGFMVKVTDISKKYMPNAQHLAPYNGARPLILVDDIDNKQVLCKMIEEMYDELPFPKDKKK